MAQVPVRILSRAVIFCWRGIGTYENFVNSENIIHLENTAHRQNTVHHETLFIAHPKSLIPTPNL